MASHFPFSFTNIPMMLCVASVLFEKTITYSNLSTGQQIQRYLEAVEMYSQLGLRTLCLGWRDLKESEYKEWSKNFQEASCSLDNREVPFLV
jgi:hypothetical protein